MSTTESVQQLPELDASYEVSSEQSRQYLENGHILLRNLISKEDLEPYRQAIIKTHQEWNKERKALQERDTYHKAFLQTGNLFRRNDVVKKFVFAKRFAKVAAKLMGVKGVRLYHDQALFKEPGGGHTPWHQDQYYWPLDTDKTITMWMPMVDAPLEMGTIVFASGSQKHGSRAAMSISDESERYFNQLVMDEDYPLAIGEMRAGDATFHSGWCLHKAPGNSTNRMREAMTIIYFADGTKVSELTNPHHPADWEAFLAPKKPGEIADGPLTPLLWSEEG